MQEDAHGLTIAPEDARAIRAAAEADPRIPLHQNLHVALLCLRRCKTHVRHTVPQRGRTELVVCPGVATWYCEVGVGESVYRCDACYATLRQEAQLSELPYASAVRQYKSLSCTLTAMKDASVDALLRAARDLISALPPCQGWVRQACPRCKFVVGPAVALVNLEEAVRVVIDQK